MKNDSIVTLDVREDLRHGREPFSKIMLAVDGLRKNERLRLIAPFEPAPLFEVLAGMGFSHATKLRKDGGYEVLFQRTHDDTEVEA